MEGTLSGPRCSGNRIVEPLDEPLKGGLLLQPRLVGSINNLFRVTIVNPTPDFIQKKCGLLCFGMCMRSRTIILKLVFTLQHEILCYGALIALGKASTASQHHINGIIFL